MTALANDTDLKYAQIDLSLYHVNSQILLQLWKGFLTGFVSDGAELAERSFRFAGRLERGSNPIPVAVRGPHAGRYRVIAHAVGPALDVTHEVVLEVTT